MKKLRPLHVLSMAHRTDSDLKNWNRRKLTPFRGKPGKVHLFKRDEALFVVVFSALARSGVPLIAAKNMTREIVKAAISNDALQYVIFDPTAGVGRWFRSSGDMSVAALAAMVGPQKSFGGTAPAHSFNTINVGEMLRSVDWCLEAYGEVEGAEPQVGAGEEIAPETASEAEDDEQLVGYATPEKIAARHAAIQKARGDD